MMFCCLVGIFLFFANGQLSAKVEQRVTLKFLVKSGKSPIECWRSLKDVWGGRKFWAKPKCAFGTNVFVKEK